MSMGLPTRLVVDGIASARIRLVFDETQPAERRETFSVPMRGIGELMRVRSFLRGKGPRPHPRQWLGATRS